MGALTTSANDRESAPQSWGIRELAREFDVTPRTIRFYEDKGLLSPERDGNARIFCQRDRDRLAEILRAKRLGFSLDDMKEVFDVVQGHVLSRDELLRRKRNFEKVISNLERKQKDIVIVKETMSGICKRIQKFVDDPQRDANVLRLADAYDAALRRHMGDDFSDDNSLNPAGYPAGF